MKGGWKTVHTYKYDYLIFFFKYVGVKTLQKMIYHTESHLAQRLTACKLIFLAFPANKPELSF